LQALFPATRRKKDANELLAALSRGPTPIGDFSMRTLLPESRAFVEELFAGLGAVEVRRLFNFDGLFCEGTIFAILADGRVFLKTDEQTRRDFEREGSKPFRYRARDGSKVPTSYYEIPARLFDEPDEAVCWGRRALDITLRSSALLRRQKTRRKTKTARQPPRRRS
jgi:DNA transformation protein